MPDKLKHEDMVKFLSNHSLFIKYKHILFNSCSRSALQ